MAATEVLRPCQDGSMQDGAWQGMKKLGRLLTTSEQKGPKLDLEFMQAEMQRITPTRIWSAQTSQNNVVEHEKSTTQVMSRNWQRLQQSQEAISNGIWSFLVYFSNVELQIRNAIKGPEWLHDYQDYLELHEYMTHDLQVFDYLLDYKCQLQKMVQALGMLYHGGNVDTDIEEHPDFIKVLSYVDKMQYILGRLDDANIPDILKRHTIRPEKAHLLASILGLNEEGAEFLSRCDEYLSLKEYALEFLIRKSEESSFEEFSSWTEEFQKLGFNDVKAQVLGEWIETTQVCPMYDTPLEWATREIESQFEYNILLNESAPGKWNDYNPSKHGPASENTAAADFEKIKLKIHFQKNGANSGASNGQERHERALSALKECTDVQRDYFDHEQKSQLKNVKNVNRWFHGTDISSARQICQEIDVGGGRQYGSFSHSDGFYLTSSMEEALTWALKKREPAILVFELKDKNIFDDYANGKEKGISWNEASEGWKQAVKYFRSGKNHKKVGLEEGEAEKLEEMEYLFGPMVKSMPHKGRQMKTDWEPEAKDPLVYQLCIKKGMAEPFFNNGENIHQVLHLLEGTPIDQTLL